MTIEEVIEHIARWVAERKTGYLQINFKDGGIGHLNANICIKSSKGEHCNGERGFKTADNR